jgi:hypothetical protein
VTARVLRLKWKIVLSLAIICAIAFAYQNHAHAATGGGNAPAFSATQLADGVLFDNGPAAAYLTTLNRPVPPSSSQTTAIENNINAAITANPTLASSLQTEFQSGNPNEVQTALSQLGSLSLPILDEMFGSSEVTQAASTLVGQINDRDLIDAIGVGTELGDYAGDWVWIENDAVVYNVVFVAFDAVAVVDEAITFNGAGLSTITLAGQLLDANIASNLQEEV